MSYSFSVTSGSKADANRQIREQFDAVVSAQPNHAVDKEAAVVASQAFVNILRDPVEGVEIYVNVYGSLSWSNDAKNKFTSASVSINASLRDKSKVE